MQATLDQARTQLREIPPLFTVTEKLLDKLHKNAEDARKACKKDLEVYQSKKGTNIEPEKTAKKKKTEVVSDLTHIPSKRDYLRELSLDNNKSSKISVNTSKKGK